MRASISSILMVAVIGLLAVGCASSEQKFSRGMRNTTEFARLGEIRRSVEQTALFDGPEKAYTSGMVSGFNKSLVRTGVGVYEMLTFPFPPYDPVFTSYLSVDPVYPDSGRPGMIADPTVGADMNLGFSGGDIAPMIPGSRFRVFDN